MYIYIYIYIYVCIAGHVYIYMCIYGSQCSFHPPRLYGMNNFQEEKKSIIFGLKLETTGKLMKINFSNLPQVNFH